MSWSETREKKHKTFPVLFVAHKSEIRPRESKFIHGKFCNLLAIEGQKRERLWWIGQSIIDEMDQLFIGLSVWAH